MRTCTLQEWYDKAVEEQRAIMREFGEELSYEALSKMEVLHAIITEALRMQPPLVMLLRYARQAMSVTTRDGKQFVIPKVGGCTWYCVFINIME